MKKIYYTEEDIDRTHNRFRVCKNKGNDCEKNEFMASHRSVKFCSEACNNMYSNFEKQQIRNRRLAPKQNNIKILDQLLQNNQLPIVTYESLIETNFIFEFIDGFEFIPNLNTKALKCGNFLLIHWSENKFLITKK